MIRVLIAIACLWLVGCGCEEIPSGHVGVVTKFGAVQPGLLPEGFSWIDVFASVIEVNTQTGPVGTEAACVSKDLQEIHTKITVQYAPVADKAICLVQKFGSEPGAWSLGILEPAVQEVTKAVSAKYTAEELVTKRAEVKSNIEQGLNEFVAKTLQSRGCDGGIHISNVAVTNFDFSKEFNQSIEAKVKAEQDALRAENEKRQKITQAEASAKERTLGAEANAAAIESESKARADAIKRESEALKGSPELVRLRAVERWDGKLPTYSGSAVPFIHLNERAP